MQNILISTIRFGAVAALALTVFVGEALAAPVLTPATATVTSNTTATLVSKVSNPGYKNTAVWFEWGETPTPTNVVGMRDVYGEGFFQGYLSGLKPGTVYYYRAAAMEGGVTVYSSVVSLTTRGGAADPATNTVQMNTNSAGVSTGGANTTNTTATPAPQASAASTNVKESTSGANTKTTTTQKAAVSKSPARDNTAATAAVNNTSGVLPGTLIGWVSLLIGLLIVFLIFAMIIDSVEERRKAREEAKKKKLEREAEVE